MTDEENIKIGDIDEKATAWVNEIVTDLYQTLDQAGISYDDELICNCLSDGFRGGYVTCLRDNLK